MAPKRRRERKEDDSPKVTPKNKNKRRTKNFKIQKISYYKAPLRFYETSVQIGRYSTDSDYQYYEDDSQLKYLALPDKSRKNMDLNEGYDTYVDDFKDEEDSFKKLIRWIASHKKEFNNAFSDGNSSKPSSSKEDLSKGQVDFICTRQVLISIFSTAYGNCDGKDPKRCYDWLIYATKFRSVIYFYNIMTDDEKEKEKAKDEDSRKRDYRGHKFEQCVTSGSTDSQPDLSRPVNVNEKYYVILKTKLNDHRILFSAEMDAVDPEYANKNPQDNNSMARFVELKTNLELNSRGRKVRFKPKLFKWYLQCFLSGITRVVCGFRNTDGILQNIAEYKVSDLPEEGEFSSDVCLKFGCDFLDYVKEEMSAVESDPNVVHKFSWKLGQGEIIHEELKSEKAFLPDSYIQEMSTS